MIGVSEAAPPRAVNQPELAVDELSQICEGLARQRPENMPALLNALALIAPLLNAIPNVVFFIKDREARYLLANLTLARRCGFKTVSSLLGKTSADVFPSTLGQGYTEQDLRVLREGVTLRDQLEMHLYNGRERGWCLTQKLALRDVRGQVIGMAGISHDLQEAHARHPAWQRLAIVDDHIRRHYHRPIAMEELTALSGMSIAQIERYCKRIFHHTPADDPQSASGKSHRTAGRRYADYRYRLAVRLYRSQRLQPPVQSDDRLDAARFSPDAAGITAGSHFCRLC